MFSEHCTPRSLSTRDLASSLLQAKEAIVHIGLAQTEPVRKKVEVTTAGKRKSRMSVCAAQNRLFLCVPAEITSAFQTNDSLEQPESAAVIYATKAAHSCPPDLHTRRYTANLMLTSSIKVGPDRCMTGGGTINATK